MEECLFCKIIAGEVPCKKIAEDDEFLAFLDLTPINKGHTLIVPKKHFEDFSQFPEALASAWTRFVKETMSLVKKGVEADAINLGMNNGSAAGQIIFHQHTHLIPRFKNDGLQNWPGHEKTPEELENIKKKIVKE